MVGVSNLRSSSRSAAGTARKLDMTDLAEEGSRMSAEHATAVPRNGQRKSGRRQVQCQHAAQSLPVLGDVLAGVGHRAGVPFVDGLAGDADGPVYLGPLVQPALRRGAGPHSRAVLPPP